MPADAAVDTGSDMLAVVTGIRISLPIAVNPDRSGPSAMRRAPAQARDEAGTRGAELALKAVAHGDAHGLAFNREVELVQAARRVVMGSAPVYGCCAPCQAQEDDTQCPLVLIGRTPEGPYVAPPSMPDRLGRSK
jgi:hypothetical protein